MRRISVFTTLGLVIAALTIQPMTAGAAPRAANHRHQHRARPHQGRAHPRTARHARNASRLTRRARTAERRLRATRASATRLRALAASRRTCLGSLDPESLRVVSLRVGLNGSPHTHGGAARALGVSMLRERLLEQISVLELEGETAGICIGFPAAHVPSPIVRLTSTAPWLIRSTI
jgi:hypothetical protein